MQPVTYKIVTGSDRFVTSNNAKLCSRSGVKSPALETMNLRRQIYEGNKELKIVFMNTVINLYQAKLQFINKAMQAFLIEFMWLGKQ